MLKLPYKGLIHVRIGLAAVEREAHRAVPLVRAGCGAPAVGLQIAAEAHQVVRVLAHAIHVAARPAARPPEDTKKGHASGTASGVQAPISMQWAGALSTATAFCGVRRVGLHTNTVQNDDEAVVVPPGEVRAQR